MKKAYQNPAVRVILIDPQELLDQMLKTSRDPKGVVYPTQDPTYIFDIDNDTYNNQKDWNLDNEGNEIGTSAD